MRARMVPWLALGLLLLAACGDPVSRFLARGEHRDRVIEAIAAHPEVGPAVVDRMLASDSTRTMLIDHLLAHGGSRQDLLVRVARDQSLLDGSIQFAVQDPETRAHVLGVLRGLQMVDGQ